MIRFKLKQSNLNFKNPIFFIFFKKSQLLSTLFLVLYQSILLSGHWTVYFQVEKDQIKCEIVEGRR